MIKLVNGIPEKLIEMDERVTLVEQMNEDKDAGPVMQINKFNVKPEEVDEFLKAFAATAEVMKKQPGYISAQLHRGIASSCVFLNYEVWESAAHFKRAISSSEFQSSIVGLPPNTIMSPHLFKKVAVQCNSCEKGFNFNDLPTNRPIFCSDCGLPAIIMKYDTSEILQSRKNSANAEVRATPEPSPAAKNEQADPIRIERAKTYSRPRHNRHVALVLTSLGVIGVILLQEKILSSYFS